jgi:hypothetical protein
MEKELRRAVIMVSKGGNRIAAAAAGGKTDGIKNGESL